MSSAKILSIDFGSSNCKAILFDETGAVISTGTEEIKTYTSEAGVSSELDSRELRSSLFSCIRKALTDHREEKLELVSITGQATSMVCLDRNGKTVRPIISHFDTRADNYGKRIKEQLPDIGYTGLRLGGSLSWIRDNDPAKFGAIKQVCDLREYLGFLLTGQLTHDEKSLSKSDVTKMSALLNVDEEIFGMPHDSVTSIGKIEPNLSRALKLGHEVPVLVCPWDGLSGVVGSGILKAGLVADIAGSTETLAVPVPNGSSFATRDHVIPSFRLFYDSFPYGLAYEWFKNLCYDSSEGLRTSQYDAIEEGIKSSSFVSQGPIFVPTLKEGWLNWITRGAIIELDFQIPKAQLMRVVMEGITMSIKHSLDRLKQDNVEMTELRVSGGGAKSKAWNQIRADILGFPVVLLQTVETGCLGAAILGAVSLGIYRNIAQSSDLMVHETMRYEPIPSNVEKYVELYSRFTKAYNLRNES